MTNETTTASRLPLLIAVVLIVAGLSMLLIPGVPAQVASVPETFWNSMSFAWSWLSHTVATAWNWIF